MDNLTISEKPTTMSPPPSGPLSPPLNPLTPKTPQALRSKHFFLLTLLLLLFTLTIDQLARSTHHVNPTLLSPSTLSYIINTTQISILILVISCVTPYPYGFNVFTPFCHEPCFENYRFLQATYLLSMLAGQVVGFGEVGARYVVKAWMGGAGRAGKGIIDRHSAPRLYSRDVWFCISGAMWLALWKLGGLRAWKKEMRGGVVAMGEAREEWAGRVRTGCRVVRCKVRGGYVRYMALAEIDREEGEVVKKQGIIVET